MKKVVLIILGVIFVGSLLLVSFYMNSSGNRTPEDFKATSNKTNVFNDVNITTSQILNSPSIIQGKANVYWFPEGWFEVILVDEGGNEISSTSARANVYPLIPDKEGYIPFVAQISFETNKTAGTLIFKEPESSHLNSGDYRVPVKFK